MSYLPVWLGAPAMALATVGYDLLTRAPIGVSGSLVRVMTWRRARVTEEELAEMETDPATLEAALLEATRAEFGDESVANAGAAPSIVREPVRAESGPLPVSAHVSFLLAIAIGAALAAAATGGLRWRIAPGAELERLFGGPWNAAIALVVGGALVGCGTRMAGGCTTGHGLAGCARLQPGSLASTAAFFGAAVVVSRVLEVLVSR